jgi:glycosyltransferase involved in cell wall biosynthesis
MSKPVFSIIIPHYNIPELLVRCINSIPVREDIQVIVVDDCSPNANKYKETYLELSRPYLEYYSTPKGGSAGRARNVGIEHAKGKWLSFVDADDLLVENAADILFKYKDRTEDVIYFQSQSVMCDDISIPSLRNVFLYHFDHYFKTGNEQPLRLEFDAPWGKLIKKTLINKYQIRFDQVLYSNDTFFSASIGVYAKSIFVPEEILYIVTERTGSLTSAKIKTFEEWEIRYRSTLRVQFFFDKHNIKYKRYAFADFLQEIWHRDKKVYFKEFIELSFRNKFRTLYYNLRMMR